MVFLANTNTEKERAETQLAQEQHKLERLENRKKFLEQVIQATISSEMKKITQPNGTATPSGAPPAKAQKRQSLPFYPLATQGFRNVRNAPRVVIPPPTQNTTCFAVCALVCDFSPKAECVPTFTRESEHGPFVREAEKHDERWSEIELLLIVRVHREPGNVCI